MIRKDNDLIEDESFSRTRGKASGRHLYRAMTKCHIAYLAIDTVMVSDASICAKSPQRMTYNV